MNINQVQFLKDLDPDQVYGTIQRVLMGGNLSVVPFENVAKYLLTTMIEERNVLVKENTLMRKEFEKNGLYNSQLLQLEG